MSASTESTTASGTLVALWRPGGLVYLGVLLGGLAVGLWPDAIYPSRGDIRPAPLPTLQTVAVAQAAFILLIYPLVLFARLRAGTTRRFRVEAAIESAGLLLAAAPFYITAAYLADATPTDVARTAIYTASLFPMGWSQGIWMGRSPAWGAWTVLDMLVVVLGLPAAYYVVCEFLTPGGGEWLRELAPLMFIWQTACSRCDSLLPRPIWPGCIWALVGAGGLCAWMLLPPERRKLNRIPDPSNS